VRSSELAEGRDERSEGAASGGVAPRRWKGETMHIKRMVIEVNGDTHILDDVDVAITADGTMYVNRWSSGGPGLISFNTRQAYEQGRAVPQWSAGA
jgi:hypothetical protein